MVEFSELSESVGGDSLEFVVGKDEVFERPGQSRKTIWHETLQPCITEWNIMWPSEGEK